MTSSGGVLFGIAVLTAIVYSKKRSDDGSHSTANAQSPSGPTAPQTAVQPRPMSTEPVARRQARESQQTGGVAFGNAQARATNEIQQMVGSARRKVEMEYQKLAGDWLILEVLRESPGKNQADGKGLRWQIKRETISGSLPGAEVVPGATIAFTVDPTGSFAAPPNAGAR